MKIKIETDVALPADWQQQGVRGNTGWLPTLREMKVGQSFSYEVKDNKSLKDFNNLRSAVYQLQKAKFNRRNFVTRLISREEQDDGSFISTYRIWAAPLVLEAIQPVAKKA